MTLVPIVYFLASADHPRSWSLTPRFRICRASDTGGREAQLSYPGLRHGDNQGPWLSFQEGTNPVGYNATNSNIQVPFSISSFPFFLSLFPRYPIPLPSFLPFLSFLSFPSFLPFLPFLSLSPSRSLFVFHFIFQFLFKHGEPRHSPHKDRQTYFSRGNYFRSISSRGITRHTHLWRPQAAAEQQQQH